MSKANPQTAWDFGGGSGLSVVEVGWWMQHSSNAASHFFQVFQDVQTLSIFSLVLPSL